MNKRIEYIDSIRGFCMFLVVFWHLSLIWGVQETSFNYSFLQLRMPLFFFISGFFAYKEGFTSVTFREKIQIRFFKQLLPTIVVGCLYCFWINVPLIDAITQDNKYGYWFTYVAFEIFIIYGLLILIVNKSKKNWPSFLIVLIILFFGICSAFSHILDSYCIWRIISGFKILKFLPFFFAGTLAKKEYTLFSKSISNQYVISACFILFVFFNQFNWKIGNAIQGYCGILAIFAIFSYYQNVFDTSTRIGICLSYVGKRTLPIYLLHYFIIYGFESLNFVALKVTESDISGFLFISIFSICIIIICLLIEKILRVAPPLYFALLGPLDKKK